MMHYEYLVKFHFIDKPPEESIVYPITSFQNNLSNQEIKELVDSLIESQFPDSFGKQWRLHPSGIIVTQVIRRYYGNITFDDSPSFASYENAALRAKHTKERMELLEKQIKDRTAEYDRNDPWVRAWLDQHAALTRIYNRLQRDLTNTQ